MEEIEGAGDTIQLLSYRTKLSLALIGLFFFPLLHKLTRLLLHRYFSWLEEGKIFRICTRVVSGFQALTVATISARSVLLCENIMKDEDPYVHAYIWFGVSYFPYDIVVMFIGFMYQEANQKHQASLSLSFVRFFQKEAVMVMHHIVILAVGLAVVEVYRKRIGNFFISCFFLAEGSTPFYSVHGIFKEIGIKDGPIYITNGLFFLASFLLCRVLSTPLMFLRYAYYKDIPWAMVPFRIPVKCTLSCFLFFLLQFYWFLRICHRMRRHIIGNVRKKV